MLFRSRLRSRQNNAPAAYNRLRNPYTHERTNQSISSDSNQQFESRLAAKHETKYVCEIVYENDATSILAATDHRYVCPVTIPFHYYTASAALYDPMQIY
jgi:hypothetical protein